jgi:hypothetical protein
MTIVRSHYHNKRLSLEQAFMLGNEMIAAGERLNDAADWWAFLARTGLSSRSVRRYIVFARWANERTSRRCFNCGVSRRSSG